MLADARRDRAAVIASLVAVQVLFGIHYFAAKILMQTIPPRVWAPTRVVGAALVLLAAARMLGRAFPRGGKDLGSLALFSLFGVAINQVCFVEGLHRTTATHSAIINTSIPVVTLLFAVLLGRESFDWRKGTSLALALTGVLMVVRPDRASFGESTLAGDLLTLANGTSYAFFLVISKRLISRVDPLAATAVLMGFGAIAVTAWGAPALVTFEWRTVPAATWMNAAFIILGPTAGAYFLIYWALARAEPSLVALFIYLQPLIAGLLAVVRLHERVRTLTIVGAVVLFSGVALATRPRATTVTARTGE